MTTTHDRIVAEVKAFFAQKGLVTEDRVVSGFTGHYLPSGLYLYVGTPKSEGPVRITTNVEIPGKRTKWMPKGSVRSAFLSSDVEAFQAVLEAMADPTTSAPTRKAPVRRQAAASQAAPSPVNPLLAEPTEEELDILAPIPNPLLAEPTEEELDRLAPLYQG